MRAAASPLAATHTHPFRFFLFFFSSFHGVVHVQQSSVQPSVKNCPPRIYETAPVLHAYFPACSACCTPSSMKTRTHPRMYVHSLHGRLIILCVSSFLFLAQTFDFLDGVYIGRSPLRGCPGGRRRGRGGGRGLHRLQAQPGQGRRRCFLRLYRRRRHHRRCRPWRRELRRCFDSRRGEFVGTGLLVGPRACRGRRSSCVVSFFFLCGFGLSFFIGRPRSRVV